MTLLRKGAGRRRAAHRRRRRGRLLAGLLAVACLVALTGTWAGGQGWQARRHLLAAAGLAGTLYEQLDKAQPEQARHTLAALQAQTRAARERTSGVGWAAGQRIPLVGQSFAAIAEVAEVLDDLAHRGLPSLVDVAGDLDPVRLAPRDGRVDLAPLQRAAPGIARAERAVAQARERIAAVPTTALIPPVKSAVVQLRHQLERVSASIGTAARAAVLVPAMLGADGRRRYLVLFQNNAEVRATGGMPGAFAVIEADGGALRILRQGTVAGDLRQFPRPVRPLDPAMRALYTDRLATHAANLNLTPHFPTAAATAREMYRRRSGEAVDGVIATDPVALSYLLRATGPVPDGDGALLTAENAVRMLLSEVYSRYESNKDQDEYYADAASATFDAAVSGGTDAPTAVRELARAAGERRLLVWSARPAEQRLLAGTVLAGELPVDDGARPVVGVFLNDGTGAKLSYYLTSSARLRPGECHADGRREVRLRLTLGSTAPRAGLPASVLGLGLAGEPYTIRTNVLVVSPAGGAVVNARLDGADVPMGTGTERQRVVGVLTVDVEPGANRTVEVTLLTGVLPRERPASAALWVTPTAKPWQEMSGSDLICEIRR